jgi:hypothetical protein
MGIAACIKRLPKDVTAYGIVAATGQAEDRKLPGETKKF